jgi:hypothetical protein
MPGHGRSGFCLEFLPEPGGLDTGLAHLPLGPFQPAPRPLQGPNLGHHTVRLRSFQHFFVHLPGYCRLHIHGESIRSHIVKWDPAGFRPGRTEIRAAAGEEATGARGCLESGSHLVLSRATTRPLARHDLPSEEQFAAPDSPGFPALEGPVEASDHHRAFPAERLCRFDIRGRLGEEQLGILPAR